MMLRPGRNSAAPDQAHFPSPCFNLLLLPGMIAMISLLHLFTSSTKAERKPTPMHSHVSITTRI